jgi:PRC-barrel domain
MENDTTDKTLAQGRLIEVKKLQGLMLHALDGEIGKVEELLFDDEFWTVRYLIVNTGNWLVDHNVLISPMALGSVDTEQQTITVNLTRDQIKNSPGAATDQPVSRQWEHRYFDYYAWPYYWNGMGSWGAYGYPGMMLSQPPIEVESAVQRARDHSHDQDNIHLRSTKEVTGYGISAIDEHLGHVSGFMVNDATWRICYLTIDTQNWWPGKNILLPPEWVTRVSWSDRSVSVSVSREQVKAAPEWEVGQPITADFEKQLYAYYDRAGGSDATPR